MGTSESQKDTSVEIRGYVTDPKQVGYQILTNYESTYWRALMGNEVWGLYEVLRSFCHNGNNTCRPSIRLLADTLGLKETRVLTGWSKRIQGKEYQYPGFIETLQQHELVTVEVQGEGTKIHYVFHLNLTPGLLTDKQLSQLSLFLQKKHAELIERCEQAKQDLAAKRTPLKLQRHTKAEKKDDPGNLPGGAVIYRVKGGNLPSEQHPFNTTHLTTTQTRREGSNNSSDDAEPPPADVVAALRQIGLSEKVAQRLAQRYNRERIGEKIEHLAFLQKSRPKKVTNPRGWLRRAIEEDYAPPDGFKSNVERQQKVQEMAKAAAENERYYEELRLQQAQEKEQALAALKQTYGTTQKELDLWAKALAEIKVSTTQPNFQAWFPQTQLLSLKEGVAVIGVPNTFTRERLEHPKTRALCKRVLDSLVGQPVTLSFAVLQIQEGNGLQQPHSVPQLNTTSD